MLTVRKGHDTEYLTGTVAKGREGYYTAAVETAGEPPGLWTGEGAATLGLAGEVDAETMKALYTFGLDPRDPNTGSRSTWAQAEVIGNRPYNYKRAEDVYAGMLAAHPDAGPEERAELRAMAGQSAKQSVAFWDVVLSAPKSLTVLWVASERAANTARATGDHETAELWSTRATAIEESLMAGHRAVLDFYAQHAGFARAGHHGGQGGRWVDGHRLVAAQFLQHDSRDKDPQLHVHGPVLNKVLCDDGKWRALDGSLVTAWREAAGAVGDRVVEAETTERLGLRWATRPDGKAREIVGIDPDSSDLFSKRTAAITPTVEKLVQRFREEKGREPTTRERSRLGYDATLVTRAGKSMGGESRDGQIARWADEHERELGVELSDVAERVFGAGAEPRASAAGAGATRGIREAFSERDVVTRALALVAERYQSWTRSQLMRAVGEVLPADLDLPAAEVPAFMEAVTDEALAQAQLLTPHAGPTGLGTGYQRADGESVFVKPGAQRFATQEQLLGEAELRAAAVRRGAPTLLSEQVEDLLSTLAAGGRELSPDQAAALRGILTSGAAVEVLAAPAGTGKSFLVATLADTWWRTGAPTAGSPTDDPAAPPTDSPRVIGLAYGQRQAAVLAEDGVNARNIAAWLAAQKRLDGDRGSADDETLRLRRGDLVVVDEAAAADTTALRDIHVRAEQAGAKLLLVGDTRQLGAVGAGGAMADIADRGIRYDLAEVRRFDAAWEGPASLRLRDGDPTVLGDYAKHGRLASTGTQEQAEAEAARAWLDDTLNGREALLVVGSNEAADRMSLQLRNELVRLGRVSEQGVRLGMQDTVAGVGDLVQARRNGWHLAGHAGNATVPVNRATYRVVDLHPEDGGLTVVPAHTGADPAAPMRLPGTYVDEHMTLAYATTVHAAQGRTVDSGFAVLGPGSDAAAAYVALTRGRENNKAFVVVRPIAPDADTGETQHVRTRDAAAVLAGILRPPDDDPHRSALAEAEQAAELSRSTPTQIDPLIEVIGDTLAGRTGRWLDQLTAAGDLDAYHRYRFAADPRRDTLDALLRQVELAGHDPARALRDAVLAEPGLDDAASVAQLLHFRVRSQHAEQLTPCVASYVDLLPRDVDPDVRPGLEALAAVADDRRAELGRQVAAEPPGWAREALGPVPDAVADPDAHATWCERAGWAASYRELADHTDDLDPLGVAPPERQAEKHAVFRAAHAALDLPFATAEEEGMSEGRLRNRVAALTREENWAPRFVAEELEAAHAARDRHHGDATIWTARADAADHAGDPETASGHRAAAEQAAEKARQLDQELNQLHAADDARAAWLVETAVTRDKSERARTALGARGIDPHSPDDRVTAAQWWAAHQAEQAQEDRWREIRSEHDVADSTGTDEEGATGRGPWQGPELDVRATSARDPSESHDPEVAERRGRDPLPDRTSATVDRAEVALQEIQTRQAAEAERLASEAEEAAAEDEGRREQWHRSPEPDRGADRGRNEDEPSDGEDDPR